MKAKQDSQPGVSVDQSSSSIYPMPFVRLELVLLTVDEGELKVLLTHRKEAPFKNRWALPGGVLRIDQDASLEAAARRVARERLGVDLHDIAQVAAVGGAKRDPRSPWALSVVYRSMVQADIAATPGKRVQALKWSPVDSLAEDAELAFDHGQLIAQAVSNLRGDVQDLHYQLGTLPEEFTLPELQVYSEAVLGTTIDKVTFRRRVDAAKLLQPIAGVMRVGAHRPAQVYRFSTYL